MISGKSRRRPSGGARSIFRYFHHHYPRAEQGNFVYYTHRSCSLGGIQASIIAQSAGSKPGWIYIQHPPFAIRIFLLITYKIERPRAATHTLIHIHTRAGRYTRREREREINQKRHRERGRDADDYCRSKSRRRHSQLNRWIMYPRTRYLSRVIALFRRIVLTLV